MSESADRHAASHRHPTGSCGRGESGYSPSYSDTWWSERSVRVRGGASAPVTGITSRSRQLAGDALTSVNGDGYTAMSDAL
jgi:hypothetical protein